MALGGGDHALLARIDELHGSAGGAGEDGGAQANVQARLALSAECPAGGRLDETNRALALEAQNPCDVLPHQEGLLGRTPDLNPAAGVRTRARRLHLEIEVIDGGRGVFVLDDHVGLPEALLDLPFSYLRLVEHVAAGEDDFRASFHRLARTGDDGQWPVFDLYQPRRRLGRLDRLRRDEGDHLAHVAHPVVGDDGHGPIMGGDAGMVGQVVSRENSDHAGDAQRLARIDRNNPGVRVFAAERLADQHPRKLEIVEIIRCARRLFGVVQKGKGLADYGAAHVFGFRHGLLPMRREPRNDKSLNEPSIYMLGRRLSMKSGFGGLTTRLRPCAAALAVRYLGDSATTRRGGRNAAKGTTGCLTPPTIIAIAGTFLLAGAVKGVIGLGLPTVSLAVLAVALNLTNAMALLLVPSFVTNVWQAVVGGHGGSLLRRIWLFLLVAAITVRLGASALTRVDFSLLTALLGLLLVAYAAASLLGLKFEVQARHEKWMGPLAGLVNGVLTGMTGSFVVPGVMYLQALGLSRDALIQAMGMLFTVSTLALGFALQANDLLRMEHGALSTMALAPAVAGMVVGQRIRSRLSEQLFRKIFFLSLLALGAYLASRAFGG